MAQEEKANGSDRPNLLERAFAAGCTRLAVVSLHPGAGARTVMESIVAEFERRGIPTGVARAPRVHLEADEPGDSVDRLTLPAGTVLITADTLARDRDELEPLEPLDCPSALGRLHLYRLTRQADVAVYGPEDPAAMRAVLEHLERTSGGLVLVDGAWERRGFAAPDVAQAVILVVGSGYSGTPERSAAAVGYVHETLTVPRCAESLREAWESAALDGTAWALDRDLRRLGAVRTLGEEGAAVLNDWGAATAFVTVPEGLHDAFLAPLTRSSSRFTLVVKDPTRIHAAPVYFKAWHKNGGRIEAVQPLRLLAVATNPVNPSGPDADPDAFRRLVSEAIPGLPVHDVRLEADGPGRRPVWKFWA